MTSNETELKIVDIAEKIVAEFDPEKIILFGSRAWGEPTESSDVDLFIIKNTHQRRLDRGREISRIIMGSGIPVDALVYTPEEVERRLLGRDFFIEKVIKHGRILYERTPRQA